MKKQTAFLSSTHLASLMTTKLIACAKKANPTPALIYAYNLQKTNHAQLKKAFPSAVCRYDEELNQNDQQEVFKVDLMIANVFRRRDSNFSAILQSARERLSPEGFLVCATFSLDSQKYLEHANELLDKEFYYESQLLAILHEEAIEDFTTQHGILFRERSVTIHCKLFIIPQQALGPENQFSMDAEGVMVDHLAHVKELAENLLAESDVIFDEAIMDDEQTLERGPEGEFLTEVEEYAPEADHDLSQEAIEKIDNNFTEEVDAEENAQQSLEDLTKNDTEECELVTWDQAQSDHETLGDADIPDGEIEAEADREEASENSFENNDPDGEDHALLMPPDTDLLLEEMENSVASDALAFEEEGGDISFESSDLVQVDQNDFALANEDAEEATGDEQENVDHVVCDEPMTEEELASVDEFDVAEEISSDGDESLEEEERGAYELDNEENVNALAADDVLNNTESTVECDDDSPLDENAVDETEELTEDLDQKVDLVAEEEADLAFGEEAEGETDLEAEEEAEEETDLESGEEAEEETDLESGEEAEGETDLESDEAAEGETDLESDEAAEGETDLESDEEAEGETDLESDEEAEGEADLESGEEAEGEADLESGEEAEGETDLESDEAAEEEVDFATDEEEGDATAEVAQDRDEGAESDTEGSADLDVETANAIQVFNEDLGIFRAKDDVSSYEDDEARDDQLENSTDAKTAIPTSIPDEQSGRFNVDEKKQNVKASLFYHTEQPDDATIKLSTKKNKFISKLN